MVGKDEIIPFLYIIKKDSKVNSFAQVKLEGFTEDEQCFFVSFVATVTFFKWTTFSWKMQ